ncbi:AMP-binding protein [Micromonospora sp. NPDC049044]|uniref:AMP-binding protein n=1 Tax=unclassified Micromonospora TaxID=2617518 RepID=UPI0033DDD485
MLHHWFLDSVRKTPDAIALVVGSADYTYADLDAVSRGIGHRLRQVAERPRVGLLASRSAAAYGGYLAALRSGGVAVPMNDANPPERLAQLTRAAGLDVVVVDRDQDASFAGAVPVVRIGAQSVAGFCATDAGPDDVDHLDGTPDDLAYLLFTSGSTGVPKGVPIRHRNLDEFVSYNIARYDVGPGSRLSATFHLTFDPSVFDMFVAWGAGATLVSPSQQDLFDPAAFVNRHRITHWYSVPSMISTGYAAGLLPAGCMPELRWSLFCGEQITLDQAAQWMDAAPHSTLENVYGPTELTVTVAAYRLPAERAAWPQTVNGTIPIGAIYPHLEHRVDPETGELQVRGPQRFGGYLDPADNVGRFVPSPTTTDGVPGPDAWYRTGDRVGRHDGQFVHLGRIDHQVKVFGQRVELPEIEHAMRTWAGVTDAVVVLVDVAGGRELAAVYTGPEVAARELRGRLRPHLPLALIPKRYLRVDLLPLNDRGKTDRLACRDLLTANPA